MVFISEFSHLIATSSLLEFKILSGDQRSVYPYSFEVHKFSAHTTMQRDLDTNLFQTVHVVSYLRLYCLWSTTCEALHLSLVGDGLESEDELQ